MYVVVVGTLLLVAIFSFFYTTYSIKTPLTSSVLDPSLTTYNQTTDPSSTTSTSTTTTEPYTTNAPLSTDIPQTTECVEPTHKMKVSWNPNPETDIAGYKVSVSTGSGDYSGGITGTTTSTSLDFF